MGWIHGQAVGQVVEATQRPEHLVGEWFGRLRSIEVGPTDGAHHQRSPGEQPDRVAVVFENVGMVLRCVSRCGQRNQRVAVAEPNGITVDRGLVWNREVRRGRGNERRAQPVGEARATSYIVGMGVRVGRPRNAKPLPLRDSFSKEI